MASAMLTDPSCTVARMAWFEWYPTVLRRYAVFDGRAGRPEFWWFQLVNVCVVVLLSIVLAAAGLSRAIADLYQLAVFLPSLGVQIRRLHDIDRSGWWVLLWFIPIVGWILMIVWLASQGTPGPNRFGESPRGETGTGPVTSFGAGYEPASQAGAGAGDGPRYCKNCGSALAPGATYCGSCGTPVA
jgi:uncharacterized membrane protein YhaH (DUF805 family)